MAPGGRVSIDRDHLQRTIPRAKLDAEPRPVVARLGERAMPRRDREPVEPERTAMRLVLRPVRRPRIQTPVSDVPTLQYLAAPGVGEPRVAILDVEDGEHHGDARAEV